MDLGWLGHEELGHVVPDPARAHHRNSLACDARARENLGVGCDTGMVYARQIGNARDHPGRDHHMIETLQIIGLRPLSQPQLCSVLSHLTSIITKGFVELVLTRRRARKVQLTAKFVRSFEKRDVMAKPRRFGRRRHSRGPAADNRHLPRQFRGRVPEFRFAPGSWIDEAPDRSVGEYEIETGLVACNAGIDFLGAAFAHLLHEKRIRQEWPSHRDHIRLTGNNNILRDIGSVDAVRGHYRN